MNGMATGSIVVLFFIALIVLAFWLFSVFKNTGFVQAVLNYPMNGSFIVDYGEILYKGSKAFFLITAIFKILKWIFGGFVTEPFELLSIFEYYVGGILASRLSLELLMAVSRIQENTSRPKNS